MKQLDSNFTRSKIKELASEYKKRRTYLNLSQIQLANIANISQSIVTKFENGKIDPTLSTIYKIEQALIERENISIKNAEEIMVKEITTISSSSSILKALNLMRDTDFSQLLVTESKNIKGIVTEKNILDFLLEKGDIKNFKVKQIIQQLPVIIPKEYLMSDLKYIFQNKKTICVLVGNQSSVIGIITKSDLFK